MTHDKFFWRLRDDQHGSWLECRKEGCLLMVRRSEEDQWYWSVTRLAGKEDPIGQDIAIRSPGTYSHVEFALRSCEKAFVGNFAGHGEKR